jgi:hypothetical protein
MQVPNEAQMFESPMRSTQELASMKVRRIVTGYDAAGKAVVKTDEQLTAVPRIGAGIKGCEIGRLVRCRSTTPRSRMRLNGLDWSSTTILYAMGMARPFASTSGRPVTRDSRIALKPWTTQSCSSSDAPGGVSGQN